MTLRHIKNINDNNSRKCVAHQKKCIAHHKHHTGRRFAGRSLSVLFALFALVVTSLAFVSCSDLFSPLNHSENPNISPNAALSESREVVISGSVNPNVRCGDGAYPAALFDINSGSNSSNRMALPTINGTKSYHVTATATGQEARNADVNETSKTFSVPLSIGSVWTITVTVDTQESGEAAASTKFKGSYTYDHALTADDVNTPVSISLHPMQTSDGKGSVALPVSHSGYDMSVTVLSEPVAGTWAAANPSYTTGISVADIKSGTYVLGILFKDPSGNDAYYCEHAVNVFDNMLTNTWVANSTGTTSSVVAGTLNVNSDIVNAYKRTNFYVSNTGNNDTADGSSQKPYATVSRVLDRIGSGTASTDYVIRLKTDIQENISIQSSLMNGTLTIKGYKGRKTIKRPNANVTNIVSVNTTIPVTIENVKLENTSTSDECVALLANTNSNVTLRNSEITKTYRTNGSAVYNSGGTVTLEQCEIKDCVSGTGSGGSSVLIYNCNVLKIKGCHFHDNTVEYAILNNAATNELTLDGNIIIPVEENQKNAIYGYSGIKIGDNFDCDENLRLTLNSYTNGSTVLVPVTTGATSVVASAASRFVLDNPSFMIGTTDTDIGKLVLNPNVYVSSSSSNPAGSSSGDGSQAHPYNTIQAAIDKIRELNTAADYVINIKGVINEAVTLSTGTDSLGTFSGSTLTILGENKDTDKISVTGTAVSLINVSSGLTVNLENLTLQGSTRITTGVSVDNASSNVTITTCDIKQNKIGIIVNAGNVTVEGCSITGNINGAAGAYGGGIYNAGTLTLKSINSYACSITGNSVNTSGYGGGVYNTGTLNIQGEVTVKDNSCGSSSATSYTDSNLYLKSGTSYIINVTGALDSKCNIHFTTENPPTPGTPLVFTSGYGTNGGSNISIANFTSDEGYEVMAGTGSNFGELVLASSGGNIGTVFDYDVALSSAATQVAPGSVIAVSATVTKNGTAVSPAPAASDITWSFTLLCAGDVVATIPSTTYPAATYITTGAGSASVKIPTDLTIFEGLPYTLHVVTTYKDTPAKDADFTLTGAQ